MHRHQFIGAVFLATALGMSCALAANVRADDASIAFDADNPASGYWIGRIDAGATKPFMALEISADAIDAPSARLFSLEMGSVNAECEQVEIEARDVTMVHKVVGRSMRIAAKVSEDGQELTGTISTVAPADQQDERNDETQTFVLHRSLKAVAQDTAMAFSGELAVPRMGKLGMSIVLAHGPSGVWVGTADVPVQGLLGMPLADVSEADGFIKATMPIPGYPAFIEARIDQDRDRLIGRFKQATIDLELELPRDHGYVSPTLSRPQHPRPPFPYEIRDLYVPTPGGFDLAGTLTIPKESGKDGAYPCAVLISGSGQQDRDETLLGHKPFLVIADALTRQGVAVFRYDDRGVGESGGRDQLEHATSADFANDAAAVVEFLKTQSGIDPDRIGLIGHSEGGLIAPLVATTREDVAFIVLLAGPGVTGREILELQGKLIFKAEGQSDEEIEAFSSRQKRLLDLVIAGADDDEIAEAYESMETKNAEANGEVADGADEAADGAGPSDLQQQIRMQLQMLNNEWMRYFLTYDPRPALAKLTCPVLAINGTLDLQVWHEQNLPEIEKVMRAAGGDITIKRYENLNHLFQPAKTGGISEYALSEVTFDEAVLKDISDWIASKIAASSSP
jgi:pimeloyl-ACP methyl ester carboxylesterase